MLLISGAGVELRVPIRRCLLGEEMARLLLLSKAGHEVVRYLLINGPPINNAPLPTEAEMEKALRVAFGPDLEAIHPNECTMQRCMESCSPAYREILTQFGLHEAIVQDTRTDCHEASSDSSETVRSSAGEE